MLAYARNPSSGQPLQTWFTNSIDNAIFLVLFYIQFAIPTQKHSECLFPASCDVKLFRSSTAGSMLQSIERHDTPMRDNVIRFKKGKKLRR